MSQAKKIIREKFRNAVFSRDGHKCVFCDCTDNLDAHHITDRNLLPNGGYVKENGITLCPFHHETAEHFHSSKGEYWAVGFLPEDLYKVIGSSYEQALAASERLKR